VPEEATTETISRAELKAKLDSLADGTAPGDERDVDLVARDALVELGWSLLDAERALAGVDPGLPAQERVRLALKKAA